MGASESKHSSEVKEVPKFGGIKNIDKPRPGYYVSGQGVYYNGELLTTDPNYFVKLNYGYAKNSKIVWFKGVPIKDADAHTFNTINRGDVTIPSQLKKYNSVLGKDSKAWYLKGNPIFLL
jgi:hypothetical protein